MGLMTSLSLASVFAFAEPAIQPGETLESLSKAKITTTVNGQPGSIKELVESGKVKVISDQGQVATSAPSTTAPADATAIDPQTNAPASSAPAANADVNSSPVEQPNAQSEAPDAGQIPAQ
ncbi:hypothetical protein [Acinetobacter shaoyimingii]|uniref:hypothetical protein n=1 Tax=Acinetobacter shaoyimingii TaxID=2715164 RepID=UPI00387824A8